MQTLRANIKYLAWTVSGKQIRNLWRNLEFDVIQVHLSLFEEGGVPLYPNAPTPTGLRCFTLFSDFLFVSVCSALSHITILHHDTCYLLGWLRLCKNSRNQLLPSHQPPPCLTLQEYISGQGAVRAWLNTYSHTFLSLSLLKAFAFA